jgi:hypothetical protein
MRVSLHREQDRLIDRLPMAEASSTSGEAAPPPRRGDGRRVDTNEAWRGVARGPWHEVPDGDYQPEKVLAEPLPFVERE